MKVFLKLVAREFRLFFSNSVAVVILIGAPAAYGLLFGFVYQQGIVTDLPVAVVDQNRTETSRILIDAMDDNQHIEIVAVVPDISLLNDDLKSGRIVGIVDIPQRFEQDIFMKRYPQVSVELSAVNIVNTNFALRGLRESLETINAGLEIEALKKQGIPATIASQQFEAFSIATTSNFNPSLNYLTFLFPGLLATILQQVLLLALALSFSKDYEDGTFSDLLNHTTSPLMVLLTKSFPYLLMGGLIWLIILHMLLAAFGVANAGSWTMIYSLSIMFILSVTAIGILVSAVIPSQLKSTEILMVIATPAFIISGFTWPLSQMPDWVVWFASVIPLTHFLEAFRNVLLAGAGWQHITSQLWAMFWLTIIPAVLTYFVIVFKIKQVRANKPAMIAK